MTDYFSAFITNLSTLTLQFSGALWLSSMNGIQSIKTPVLRISGSTWSNSR